MNIAVDQLSISLFKKPLRECSAEELKQLSRQYPWFGPAQLLYAKKLQAGNESIYEDQVQKTALYFPNRLWLHHLLNDKGSTETTSYTFPSEKEKTTGIENREETQPSPLSEQVALTATATEAPVPTAEESGAIAEPGKEFSPKEETQPSPLSEQVALTTTATEAPVPTAEESGAIAEPGKEFSPKEETVTEPIAPPMEEPEEEYSANEETGMVSAPPLEIPKMKIEPVTHVNAPLVFQPYHTVDYFASQGIKFKEHEKPQDHFGQQLKSFTEWLKTLKRVPLSDLPVAVSDPGGEQKAEQLAEHSLAERHVITEAMAEVWIKQGNRAKAEEIYRKLSLLDPPKTAYFAAKIEELKKTS